MTIQELIEHLQELPPETQVQSYTVTLAEWSTPLIEPKRQQQQDTYTE